MAPGPAAEEEPPETEDPEEDEEEAPEDDDREEGCWDERGAPFGLVALDAEDGIMEVVAEAEAKEGVPNGLYERKRRLSVEESMPMPEAG